MAGYYETAELNDLTFVERDGMPFKLNVICPVGLDGPRPLVLWIHGGGWAGGGRAGLQEMSRVCASLGYVAATTDYRLTTGGYRFPDPLEDVAAAWWYLHDNAERFNIDISRVVIGGDSAGGHLALLLGMCREPRLLGLESADQLPPVRGIVNVYGPTDLSALEAIRPYNPLTRPLLMSLMGAPPDKSPEQWKNASPISFVCRDGPPILTIHGDCDSIVPFSQAMTLDERCESVGHPHHTVRLKGAEHGWVAFPNYGTMLRVMPVIAHFIADCVGR